MRTGPHFNLDVFSPPSLEPSRVSVRPSNKTSFIVLGSDPGAKKLELIRKNNLKTINEDGFLDLIASRPAGKL
jgi:replication factor C subunit 1